MPACTAVPAWTSPTWRTRSAPPSSATPCARRGSWAAPKLATTGNSAQPSWVLRPMRAWPTCRAPTPALPIRASTSAPIARPASTRSGPSRGASAGRSPATAARFFTARAGSRGRTTASPRIPTTSRSRRAPAQAASSGAGCSAAASSVHSIGAGRSRPNTTSCNLAKASRLRRAYFSQRHPLRQQI